MPASTARTASASGLRAAAHRRLTSLTAAAATAGLLVLGAALAAPANAAAPTPGQTQPPGTAGLVTMLSWGGWLVSFVCVAGILVVAAMMAIRHRRGESGESLGALGWVLGACVLGSAAGPLANALI